MWLNTLCFATHYEFIVWEDLIVSACLFIVRRSLIEKTGIRFIEGVIHEDDSFHFQLLWHADRVGVLNEPLYFRRYRVGSIMTARNYRKSYIGYVTALISINNTRCTSEDFDKYCRTYFIRYISVANGAFSHLSLSEYRDSQIRQMSKIEREIIKCNWENATKGAKMMCKAPNLYFCGNVVRRIITGRMRQKNE